MVDLIPDKPKKGRGAVSNASGRYEPFTRVAVDDGWDRGPAAFSPDGRSPEGPFREGLDEPAGPDRKSVV